MDVQKIFVKKYKFPNKENCVKYEHKGDENQSPIILKNSEEKLLNFEGIKKMFILIK